MKITPEFISSLERLNVFYHVHDLNKDLMKHVGDLLEKLQANPGQTLHPEALIDWLSNAGDRAQTVDALMHIAQANFVGEAKEWSETADQNAMIDIRDNVNTPVLDQMEAILLESTEERTQRILLEMLNIHE